MKKHKGFVYCFFFVLSVFTHIHDNVIFQAEIPDVEIKRAGVWARFSKILSRKTAFAILMKLVRRTLKQTLRTKELGFLGHTRCKDILPECQEGKQGGRVEIFPFFIQSL